MIKTFENCSPEYQITLVCFFILLTLLYIILVIYEGTGKRQRKMLLLDSVLLIVIFLITVVLCVWQRAFYEEASMILFKIPYVILIVIGIGVFLYVGLKIFGIYKYRKSCLRENAVQESLDNLPSGIGFFDRNGMPKLMNRKMYQLCRNLAGRDIQNSSLRNNGGTYGSAGSCNGEPGDLCIFGNKRNAGKSSRTRYGRCAGVQNRG